MIFSLPDLDADAFRDPGITLFKIMNPNLPALASTPAGSAAHNHALNEEMLWIDAVYALFFRLSAANAGQTLPIVLRECARPATVR